MKKRLIVESLSIALLTVTLMSTIAFAAWPDYEEEWEQHYGDYGSWVACYVYGDYDAQGYFDYKFFASWRGTDGPSEIEGDMVSYWIYGETYEYHTTSGDSQWGEEDEWSSPLAATYTWSQFEYNNNVFVTHHYVSIPP